MTIINALQVLLLFFHTQEAIDTYLSFKIDNKEIVWVQTYHEDHVNAADLSEQMLTYLRQRGWIENIQIDGNDIVADISKYKIDYKRYGAKFLNTSAIVRTGRWTGKVRVMFKDDKYRVIVYGLNYVAMQATSGEGKMTIQQHEVNGSLTEWALNGYRTAFRKSRFENLDVIHNNLKDSFTLIENQVIDNDW